MVSHAVSAYEMLLHALALRTNEVALSSPSDHMTGIHTRSHLWQCWRSGLKVETGQKYWAVYHPSIADSFVSSYQTTWIQCTRCAPFWTRLL